MSRRVQVVLTLVLFTAIMAVWGVAVNATVPSAVDWARERVGHVGLWIPLIVLWIVCCVLLYRERGIRLKGK